MADLDVRGKSELRKELTDFLASANHPKLRSMIPAVQSILAALDYDDSTLLKSATEWSGDEMTAVVTKMVAEKLGAPDTLDAAFRVFFFDRTIVPSKKFDQIGASLTASIDGLLGQLIELRDGPVRMLVANGFAVPNADRLESDIARLHGLKERYLARWPRSDNPPPVADRDMVEKSRAEFDRGEGVPVEQLLRQCGGSEVN